MKHILVPIGSSENSKNTLQYAIDLANIIGARVFVMRAYKMLSKAGSFVNADATMQRETNLYLQMMIKNCYTKNVDIKIITAKGDVLDSITSVNRELGIDLLVMGPKSNSIKEEVFLGKTSGRVLKQTNIPMLIIPDGYAFKPFKSVLTAFKSGILNDKSALTPLQFIADKFNATVNLLLVKTPSHTDEDLTIDNQMESLSTNTTITEGATTFQGVLAHFKEQNPDLLCVFRRKRGFFNKLWEKNTILKSEFNCSVPLLVLRGKI